MRSGLWRRISLMGLGWCLLGALGLVYGFGEQPAGSAPLPHGQEPASRCEASLMA